MKVEVRQRRDVTILEPQGKITIGAGDITLRDAVIGALDTGSRKIVLVLRSATTIDSSGIMELVMAFTTATNRGGKLKLACPTVKISDILFITQLGSIFEVFDDEDSAIESFNA
jgi:anti-sigma B factor antagonist